MERRGKVGWIPESYLKKCTNVQQDEDIGDFLGLIGNAWNVPFNSSTIVLGIVN